MPNGTITGAAALNRRQQHFVEEYCIDNNGCRAAIAAGYASNSAKVTASRLLTKANVQRTINAIMAERAERLRVSGDRVLLELARIGFADPRDYDDGDLDVRRLNADQAAAIANINIDEVTDLKTGVIRRRVRVKLHDKVAALNGLAKALGMHTERHVIEGTIEHVISQLSPEERIERVRQLRQKAESVYLPLYEAALQAQQGGTIDAAVASPDDTAGHGLRWPRRG